MKKILVIHAGMKPEGSKSELIYKEFINNVDKETFKVSDYYISDDNEFFYIDKEFFDMYSKIDKEQELNQDETKRWDWKIKRAKEFANADLIVFVTPIWAGMCPPALINYINLVIHPGITFDITEDANGVQGALTNKFIYIQSSGGPENSAHLSRKHIQNVIGGLGVKEFESLLIENTETFEWDEIKDKYIKQAKELAERVNKEI